MSRYRRAPRTPGHPALPRDRSRTSAGGRAAGVGAAVAPPLPPVPAEPQGSSVCLCFSQRAGQAGVRLRVLKPRKVCSPLTSDTVRLQLPRKRLSLG